MRQLELAEKWLYDWALDNREENRRGMSGSGRKRNQDVRSKVSMDMDLKSAERRVPSEEKQGSESNSADLLINHPR